jgi:hypothetical protein
MILMGGIGASGLGRGEPLSPAAYAISGALVVAGACMFLRRPFSFWVAMAASLLLALSGVLAFLHHPELSLPVHPAISLVVGLYLCLRTLIARPGLNPPRKRSFLSEDPS